MIECTIQREQLLESLQSVVSVVEARQTVPILSHVLIEVDVEAVTMQCTDNEMSITSRAAVHNTVRAGKTTVSAYTLLEIVRRLSPNAIILLKQEANQLLLESGSSHFRLMSLNAEDFPYTVLAAGRVSLSVQEGLLYEAIKTTHFAMAQNNPRYYLNGMLWDIKGGDFELVATDAHRLAKRSIVVDGHDKEASIIVPRKAIIELSKLLVENSEKWINLSFTDNQLCVNRGSYQLTSRLIAGTFPDYEKLLPTFLDRTAIIDRNLLKSALSKLAPLLKYEIYKGVRLEFSRNSLKLRVLNSKQETGEESLAIRYQMDRDEIFSIAFNIDYLDKVAEALVSDEIKLTLPEHEGVTQLEQYTEQPVNGPIYLIMPILL